jgi:hypothetical protein
MMSTNRTEEQTPIKGDRNYNPKRRLKKYKAVQSIAN